MISKIHIERYKSIKNLPLELGRINVFIGENGAGKSNILEAIALAGAAAADKLDNEFLASRGIRVTMPENMRPAFEGSDPSCLISVSVQAENHTLVVYEMQNDNAPYSKWTRFSEPSVELDINKMGEIIQQFAREKDSEKLDQARAFRDAITALLSEIEKTSNKSSKSKKSSEKKIYTVPLGQNSFVSALFSAKPVESARVETALKKFVIYSPENTALRTLQPEGQIEPLGVNGEGVFKMFSFYSRLASSESSDPSVQREIEQARQTLISLKSSLRLLGWFEDVKVGKDGADEKLEIKDLYVGDSGRYLDHTSANEGFLFLLFYFLLFTSDLTPNFFAIDNIDASLNPRLCQRLMIELTRKAKLHNKQVILTTHNPAILDGLDLNDDEQRLFIVSRAPNGETKAKRFVKKNAKDGVPPPKLSELFLRGVIGGLPKSF